MKDTEMFVLLLLLLLLGAHAASSTFPVPVRLVGGAGRCDGTVELQKGAEWRRVKPSDLWHSMTFTAVCEHLDCGAPVYVEQSGSFPDNVLWLVEESCLKQNHMSLCISNSAGPEGVQVVCSESLRLSSGPSLCSGNVQIRLDQNQSWTSVCDGALDLKAAEVLCRELGCGAPSALQRVRTVESGPLLEQMFQCEGQESALINCSRSSYSCTSGVAAVVCSEPVRLVDGSGRCEGKVEVGHRDQWSPLVTFQDKFWDLDLSAALCRDLDCGRPVSMTRKRDLSESPVWNIPADCVKKSRATVRGCMFNQTSPSASSLNLVCSDSVRLRSGPTLCSGTVQVRLDQSWNSVCDEAFDMKDAEVLCRELGCGAPSVLQRVLSGEDGPPLGQTFHCEGHESALKNCAQTSSICTSGIALALACSEPLRLAGGASRCAGTMELKDGEEWKRLFPKDNWNRRVADSVCRDLDCGTAVSVTQVNDLPRIQSQWISAECVFEKTAGVRQCVISGTSSSLVGLDLVCSDLLNRPTISVTEGLSGSELRQVPPGSAFWVKCSADPQYPGGSFELLSPIGYNHGQPTVNHTAYFLFSKAVPAHEGQYICVYRVEVFSHNFTSQSGLQILPGGIIYYGNGANQVAVLSQLTSLLLLLLGLAAGHMF